MKKKILYSLLAVIIIIQFFRVDKTNPKITKVDDFITITQPPVEVANMLKSACYDCHSNETKYPWYCNVSPVSWWIKHHINEGRRELNFSNWGKYKTKRKNHKFKEMTKEIKNDEMRSEEHTSELQSH